MFTSLLSLVAGPVHSDMAMTGEITLRGSAARRRIKEKVPAAKRAGVKRHPAGQEREGPWDLPDT
jgi:ATP-dependent Lon protease